MGGIAARRILYASPLKKKVCSPRLVMSYYPLVLVALGALFLVMLFGCFGSAFGGDGHRRTRLRHLR
jgi:hypothetical protein